MAASSDTGRKVGELYGGRVRVRACGLVLRENKLLLALHRGVGPLGYLWVPPGGGGEFGETLAETVARELWEECGIRAEVGALFKLYEYINLPLHAIELFYKIDSFEGNPILGRDPEMDGVLTELRWMGPAELKGLEPGSIHQVVTDFFE